MRAPAARRHGNATVFNDSPAAQAKAFANAGCEWLHLVDLNGAVEGHPVNRAAVASILKAVEVPAQLGGGIRTIESIAGWIEAGVSGSSWAPSR